MAEKQTGSVTREGRVTQGRTDEDRAGQGRRTELQRIGEWRNPFGLLQRFADEMDRMFEGAMFGRTAAPATWRGVEDIWAPQVDVFQRGTELVIRADVPGLDKDDIKVELQDDAIVIQGERRREHEDERNGVYRSERSYGSFYRAIPLPQGSMTDQATARFKNGVLEIVMPAPPEQVNRGRRLEIQEGESQKK
jgi:HSP20 family protein